MGRTAKAWQTIGRREGPLCCAGIEPAPAPDDILVRPAGGDVLVESDQDMQVVIQNGESPDRESDDLVGETGTRQE